LDSYGNSVRAQKVTLDMMSGRHYNLFDQSLLKCLPKELPESDQRKLDDIVHGQVSDAFQQRGYDAGVMQVHEMCTVLGENGIDHTALAIQKLFSKVVDTDEISGTQFSTIPRLLHEPWDSNLIARALCDDLVIRNWQPFIQGLERIGEKCFSQATSHWAVAVCSVHGQEYCFGPDADTEVPLTDLVKPFIHALAVRRSGNDAVHRWVGQEPTALNDDDFSTFVDPAGNVKVPYNALTDLGSLVCSSMAMAGVPSEDHVPLSPGAGGTWPPEHLEKDLEEELQQFAGGSADPHHVLKSYSGVKGESGWKESQLSDFTKNAFLLKSNNMYPWKETDPEAVLDTLIQLGSTRAKPGTAALMGATIANGGVCPTTRVSCIEQADVAGILSQMYVCGMGEDRQWWGMHTGIPAVQSQEGMLMLTIPSVACVVVYCKTPTGAPSTELQKKFTRKFASTFPASLIGQLLPDDASLVERPGSAGKREAREAFHNRRRSSLSSPPSLAPSPT